MAAGTTELFCVKINTQRIGIDNVLGNMLKISGTQLFRVCLVGAHHPWAAFGVLINFPYFGSSSLPMYHRTQNEIEHDPFNWRLSALGKQ